MSDSGATERAREPTVSRAAAEPEPDVLLDVPELSVDEIRLAVDGLDADLSLRARLANLLQLDAGVRVHLEGVELDITGVRAETLLKVRLEKLVQILDRALTTIDRNPQLIDALARSVGVTVDDVHRAAGRVAGPVVEEVAETGEVLDRAGRQVAETGEVLDRTAGSATAGEIAQATPPRGERPAGSPADEPGPGTGDDGRPAGAGQAPEADPGRTVGPAPTGAGAAAGPEADTGETSGSATKAGAGGADAPGGDAAGAADAGGARAGSGAGPGSGGPAREQSPSAGAGQLAGQAGQTLRQAGRSVWEAIQNGMGQQRSKR